MWLVNTTTLKLHEFWGNQIPQYAILSHTWTRRELKFQDMAKDGSWVPYPNFVRKNPLLWKVEQFCRIARNHNLEYAWIDTCCIDKGSSAELTEAINSMYNYYSCAAICVIYLVDVPGKNQNIPSELMFEQVDMIRQSRWFTRGWTLQELLACMQREFYANDWSLINGQQLGCDMARLCSEITGIRRNVLIDRGELLASCIAERMSWAAHRRTSRPEDGAYSLMGMFRVNMPILYGEGLRGAFRRLQDEIMKSSFDQTLFAWRSTSGEDRGMLAHYPSEFANTPRLGLWRTNYMAPFAMTNIGLSFRACVLPRTDQNLLNSMDDKITRVGLRCVMRTEVGWQCLAIYLSPIENLECWANGKPQKAYRRVLCDRWDIVHPHEFEDGDTDLVVLEDEHFDLVANSNAMDRVRAKANTLHRSSHLR